jgi:hypothetical protein
MLPRWRVKRSNTYRTKVAEANEIKVWTSHATSLTQPNVAKQTRQNRYTVRTFHTFVITSPPTLRPSLPSQFLSVCCLCRSLSLQFTCVQLDSFGTSNLPKYLPALSVGKEINYLCGARRTLFSYVQSLRHLWTDSFLCCVSARNASRSMRLLLSYLSHGFVEL